MVVGPEDLEIHIVARYPLPRPIPEIAESIRSASRRRPAGARPTVVVDDLDVAEDESLNRIS